MWCKTWLKEKTIFRSCFQVAQENKFSKGLQEGSSDTKFTGYLTLQSAVQYFLLSDALQWRLNSWQASMLAQPNPTILLRAQCTASPGCYILSRRWLMYTVALYITNCKLYSGCRAFYPITVVAPHHPSL